MIPEFESTFTEHVDELVRIRIAAMRDSLTKVGRFDPDCARERFVFGFNPEYTRFINVSGLRVGFVFQDETEWDINYIRMACTH